MTDFPTRIKDFRRARGLTTRQLAERLGTSQPTVTRMEGGTQAVTVEWLHKIGQVLKVNPAALIDFETVYAAVRGDLGPDRKAWLLIEGDDVQLVPVPTVFDNALRGRQPIDAFQISERALIFCDRAQQFSRDATDKRHVLHIRDESGEGLCLATFEDHRFGPGFRTVQGYMPAPWLNLWDERISRKWRAIAEYRGE